MIIKNCLCCKKNFKARRNSQKYCNTKCSGKHLGLTRKKGKIINCKNCNKKVYKMPSEINGSCNNFCSRSCSNGFNNKKFVGENARNYINGDYLNLTTCEKIGNEARKNGQCSKCGYNTYTEILEVHHIDRNRGNNNINNLIVLCPNCHQIEHLKTNSGRYNRKKNKI